MVVDWVALADFGILSLSQNGQVTNLNKYGNKYIGSKCEKFLEHVSNY